MLRHTLFFILMALSVFWSGCGKREPVIIGSSETAFQESFEKICQGVPAEEKEKLDKAVERLIVHHTAQIRGKIKKGAEVRAYALMQMDGLTGKEILRRAAAIP